MMTQLISQPTPASKLAELQEQYDALQMESKVASLQSQLRHHEMGRALLEGWGEFIDPLDYLTSEPGYFGGGGSSIGPRMSRPSDRANGDNAPFFRSEQELAAIRGAGEWIAKADATAVGALEILTSYVIGTDGQYDACEKEEVAGAEQAAAAVQPVIDDFLRRCRWNLGCNSLDRETFKRWRRSGEAFLQIRDMGGGYARLRVWEPSWITEPLNAREVEEFYGLPELDWKYGVATAPGDATEVWGYYGLPNGGSLPNGQQVRGEFIPATEMMHLKCNVESNVKRGMSDFFPAQIPLEKASKVEDRVLDGGAIQASIALVRKHSPQVSNQRISNAAGGLVEFETTLPGFPSQGGASRSVPTRRFLSGTVVDEKNVELEPGPMGQSQAPTYLDIVDHGRGSALRTWSMHRALATGTADATTYASELSNESPFTKFGEGVQGEFSTASEEMLWRIIDLACMAGRIPYEPQNLRQLIEVKCTLPDIAVRDKLQEHTIRKEENEAGVLSLETWCEETQRSFEKEQSRGAKAQALQLAEIAAEQAKLQAQQQPSARQAAFMEALLIESRERHSHAVA